MGLVRLQVGRQKACGSDNALATRTQVQTRDVFDLNHLSPYAAAGREALPELVTQAMEQLTLLDFNMFKDQVVPFLPSELAAHYGTPEAWKALSEKVWSDLAEALRSAAP